MKVKAYAQAARGVCRKLVDLRGFACPEPVEVVATPCSSCRGFANIPALKGPRHKTRPVATRRRRAMYRIKGLNHTPGTKYRRVSKGETLRLYLPSRKRTAVNRRLIDHG